MSSHEQRITARETARKEIEEALIVMAHLDTRQSNFCANKTEYLASHKSRIRQQEERSRVLDERIDKLVSAIGEGISRQ